MDIIHSVIYSIMRLVVLGLTTPDKYACDSVSVLVHANAAYPGFPSQKVWLVRGV